MGTVWGRCPLLAPRVAPGRLDGDDLTAAHRRTRAVAEHSGITGQLAAQSPEANAAASTFQRGPLPAGRALSLVGLPGITTWPPRPARRPNAEAMQGR